MADKIKTFLKKFKIWRSFKLRLLIIIFLMGIIPSIIMRLGILENYESRAVAVRISDVQTQLRIIANHLITYNYLQDTSSEVIGAELEQISNLYNGRVLIINGNLKVVKDTYGISEGKTIVSEEVIRCMKGKNTADYDSVNRFIEITIPIVETVSVPDDNGGEAREKEVVRGVMLTSVSTDTIVNTLDILNRQAIIMGNIMFIFIFALAICLARILVRPFERVTRAISEVKEGYTDEPISVSDYLETEHIVDAFNSLIKRMKTLDDSRQEFVANVSHELKTPITSIKVLADSLLAQEDVPAELYHEFMEDIAEEIERENKIINDLLSLVKMDKAAGTLNVSVVNINELLELIFPFLLGRGKQLLDDFKHGHDVTLFRFAKFRHQKDSFRQQPFGGVIEICVLSKARLIHAGQDDGLGDNFCVLLRPGFVGQLALLLVQIGVFVDKVQEIKAIAFRGVAQVNNGNPVAVAVPGDACVVPKNVALCIR